MASCIEQEHEENTVSLRGIWGSFGTPHRSNETYSPKKEELGNTSPSLRASVISIPELFTYAHYFVIAFELEVIYLAITLLLFLLSISCWCT